MSSLCDVMRLTQSRSENARHWAVQQRQYPPTASVLGALPAHSTVAYVGAKFQLFGGASPRGGEESLFESIFPTVSIFQWDVVPTLLTEPGTCALAGSHRHDPKQMACRSTPENTIFDSVFEFSVFLPARFEMHRSAWSFIVLFCIFIRISMSN